MNPIPTRNQCPSIARIPHECRWPTDPMPTSRDEPTSRNPNPSYMHNPIPTNAIGNGSHVPRGQLPTPALVQFKVLHIHTLVAIKVPKTPSWRRTGSITGDSEGAPGGPQNGTARSLLLPWAWQCRCSAGGTGWWRQPRPPLRRRGQLRVALRWSCVPRGQLLTPAVVQFKELQGEGSKCHQVSLGDTW